MMGLYTAEEVDSLLKSFFVGAGTRWALRRYQILPEDDDAVVKYVEFSLRVCILYTLISGSNGEQNKLGGQLLLW